MTPSISQDSCVADMSDRVSDVSKVISSGEKSSLRKRQQLETLQRELTELDAVLNERRAMVMALQKRLQTMNRERAVARRKIPLLQNELYQARHKRGRIEAQLAELTSLLANREQTIRTLEERRRRLEMRQAELKISVRELTSRLEILSEGRPELEAALADLEARKAELVEDIACRLQRAVLEWAKVEEDLYRLVVEFRDISLVRDDVIERFELRKAGVTALQAGIEAAEDRVDTLKRVQSLKLERDVLSNQIAIGQEERKAVEQALENALIRMQAGKHRLSELKANLDQTTREVETLQIEIGPYRDALERAAVADSNLEVCRLEVAGALQSIADRIASSYAAAREASRLSARVAWIAGLQGLPE